MRGNDPYWEFALPSRELGWHTKLSSISLRSREECELGLNAGLPLERFAMPFWIANLCDCFTEYWLTATPSTYRFAICFIVGLGWALTRARS